MGGQRVESGEPVILQGTKNSLAGTMADKGELLGCG